MPALVCKGREGCIGHLWACALGGLWQALATNGLNGVAGIVAGSLVLGAVTVVQKLRKR